MQEEVANGHVDREELLAQRELHSTSAVPTREYGFGLNEVDWASANPQYTHLWLIEQIIASKLFSSFLIL